MKNDCQNKNIPCRTLASNWALFYVILIIINHYDVVEENYKFYRQKIQIQSKQLGKYSLHLLRAKKGPTKTKLGEDVRLERHLEGNTQVNIKGLCTCKSELLAFDQLTISQLKGSEPQASFSNT